MFSSFLLFKVSGEHPLPSDNENNAVIAIRYLINRLAKNLSSKVCQVVERWRYEKNRLNKPLMIRYKRSGGIWRSFGSSTRTAELVKSSCE